MTGLREWAYVLRQLYRANRRPRVHPAFVQEADRARLARLTGRDLGPSVPVEPEFRDWRDHAWEARFAAVLEATPDELGDLCEEIWERS